MDSVGKHHVWDHWLDPYVVMFQSLKPGSKSGSWIRFSPDSPPGGEPIR